MTTASAIEFAAPPVRRQSLWRYWRGGLRGSEFTWALAFLVPYIGVFFAFVVYPVFYGLWMGSEPSLYTEVFSDPIYQQTVVNTLVFVTFGVNLKLFFALLLSGFFMRPGWWVKGLLMIFVLPWAVPALPSFISIHWMLNGEWGLLNNFLVDCLRCRWPVLAQFALARARVGRLLPCLEVAAVLDRDPARRQDVDPAGDL